MSPTLKKIARAELEGKQNTLQTLMDKIKKKSASASDIENAKELAKEIEKIKRSLKSKEE